jgi:CopG family nickel-responsive transcriptional regulator
MKTDKVERFSVSMSGALLDGFDALAKERGFANRSQALAELVRAQLVERNSQAGSHEIAGTVTLVYDHHKRNIQALLTAIQHDHGDLIIAALHVHLDHHNCMEVLAVRGKAAAVRRFADALIAVKGVKHGQLTVTTTGKDHMS